MKIALYTNSTLGQNDNSLLFEAFKSNPQVSEVIILNPLELQVSASSDGVKFTFGEFALDKSNVDLVVFRGGLGDVNLAIRLVKYCQDLGIKTFDNNLHKVRYLINKKADIIKFASQGLPIPQTRILNDISQLISLDLPFPLIMKTSNTGIGKNVFKVNSVEEVSKNLETLDKKFSEFLFQEFIDYELDLRLVVVGGEVLAAMRRIPQPGEFRANYSIGGSVERFDAPEDMKKLAIRAVEASELEISGVDILVDKKGKYYVLETNRTPGLEGISKAQGINIAEKIVEYIIR